MTVDLFPSIHTDDLIYEGEAMHRVALLRINHTAVAERADALTRQNIARHMEPKNEESLRGSDVSGVA